LGWSDPLGFRLRWKLRSSEQTWEACRQASFSGYLAKPFEETALIRAVEKLLPAARR